MASKTKSEYHEIGSNGEALWETAVSAPAWRTRPSTHPPRVGPEEDSSQLILGIASPWSPPVSKVPGAHACSLALRLRWGPRNESHHLMCMGMGSIERPVSVQIRFFRSSVFFIKKNRLKTEEPENRKCHLSSCPQQSTPRS